MYRLSSKDDELTKICLVIEEEFETVDEGYVLVRRIANEIHNQVFLSNEVMNILVVDYRPFVEEILFQLIRKAHRRASRAHNLKSHVSILPCRREIFQARIVRNREAEHLIIETIKKCPTLKGVQ